MPGTTTRARGALESEILRLLWARTVPIGARELLEGFTEPIPAYTTILTTLERLEKKGLVERSGDSPRRVLFAATSSEDEHVSRTMIEALGDSGDRQATLLRFAGNLGPEDLSLLRSALTP